MADGWTRVNRTVGVASTLAASAIVLALPGCDEKASGDVVSVKLGGKVFHLELAAEDAKRMKGLGGRTQIAPDGGMLFVFADHFVTVQNFVMRDCPIGIDIIFLDRSGRIVAMHKMKAEVPRKPDESEIEYETRLVRYSSRFSAQFVIELAADTLDSLNLKEGEKVDLDVAWLRARAK